MLMNNIRCSIQLDNVQRLAYPVRTLELVMAVPLSESATRHLRYWFMTHMHVVRLCGMRYIRQQLMALQPCWVFVDRAFVGLYL